MFHHAPVPRCPLLSFVLVFESVADTVPSSVTHTFPASPAFCIPVHVPHPVLNDDNNVSVSPCSRFACIQSIPHAAPPSRFIRRVGRLVLDYRRIIPFTFPSPLFLIPCRFVSPHLLRWADLDDHSITRLTTFIAHSLPWPSTPQLHVPSDALDTHQYSHPGVYGRQWCSGHVGGCRHRRRGGQDEGAAWASEEVSPLPRRCLLDCWLAALSRII